MHTHLAVAEPSNCSQEDAGYAQRNPIPADSKHSEWNCRKCHTHPCVGS